MSPHAGNAASWALWKSNLVNIVSIIAKLCTSSRWVSIGLPLAIWLTVVGAGWWSLVAYGLKYDAKPIAVSWSQWPTNSSIERIDGRPLLIVFLHPKCPCSHATVAELYRLTERLSAESDWTTPIRVVACTPKSSADESWKNTPLLDQALKLTNARLYSDPGGREASRFGAEVSGTVMLFDNFGQRLYSGGITPARGHVGQNAGGEALTRLLTGEPTPIDGIPALGCRLIHDDGQLCANTCGGANSREGEGR